MDDLRQLAVEGGRALGVSLTSAQIETLCRYAELVAKWSKRINLTATRDARGFLSQHILDALALLPHVPATARTLVDVGSGAGIPGLVLAIATPGLRVVALEPIRKKHAFLSTARRELALASFTPLPHRLESHQATPGVYDVAVSRATFALPEWLSRGAALVTPGRVLGMEGATRHDLPEGAARFPYQLPHDTSRSRAIIVLDVPGTIARPEPAREPQQ